MVAEANTNARIINTHSLENVINTTNNSICDFIDGGAQITSDCKVLTESYMKTQNFVNDLNNGSTNENLAWKLNSNGGYPLLSWQNTQ